MLETYQDELLALLGSIQAHQTLNSRDSSRVIRDLSKRVEGLGVDLRKSLIEADKQLTIKE